MYPPVLKRQLHTPGLPPDAAAEYALPYDIVACMQVRWVGLPAVLSHAGLAVKSVVLNVLLFFTGDAVESVVLHAWQTRLRP